MATVTMDVTELDKMRGDIKILGDENTKLNKELIEVRADKRVMTITKRPKSAEVSFTRDAVREALNHGSSVMKATVLFPGESTYYLDIVGNRYNQFHMESSSILYKEETSFTNMDDVKEQIAMQLDANLVRELAQLKTANVNV